MNRATKMGLLAAAAFALNAAPANAGVWCDVEPGWYIATHGTMGDNVFMQAKLPGAPDWIWIQIASSTVGKSNVALVLAAQVAEKDIAIYLENHTCANFPNWAPMGNILHIRLKR